MTLLGGFRNFAGPIVGAVVYTYLKTYAIATTQYWQFLLGLVLLILVMALPIGLVGAASRLVGYGRERWRGAEPGLAAEDRERRGGAAT